MPKIRKLCVGLMSIFLFVSLLLISLSTGLKLSLYSPNKTDVLIDGTNLYGAFINKAANEADSALGGGQDGTIKSELKIMARTSLTKAEFDDYANQLVSANYDWLSGKTNTPIFKINLTSNKNNFANQVGTYVKNQLNTLPDCSATQELQLINANTLTLTCRPNFISPTVAADQISNEIKTSTVFLGNPVLTPASLNANNNNVGKPYYKKLNNASKLYNLGKCLPYISLLVAIICSGVIWLASQKNRKAIRSVSYAFALSGIILIASKILSVTIDHYLDKKLSLSHNLGFLHVPILQYVNSVGRQLSKINFLFGLSYVLISIILLLFTKRIQKDKAIKLSRHEANNKQPLGVVSTNQSENTIDLSPIRVRPPAIDAIRPSSDKLAQRALTAPPMPTKSRKRRNLIQ